jgi:hypothetical protein
MKANHGQIFSLVLAAASFLLVACEQISRPNSHFLRLVLPTAPSSWVSLPELELEVSWRDEEGAHVTSRASFGGALTITVERGVPQAILALPLSRNRALRPAGILYPEGLEAGESEGDIDLCRLDWLGGYAARVWRLLESGGVDPCSFDITRLVSEASARCSDPWIVDPSEVARCLVASSFRLSLYKDGDSFSVILPDSAWAPESPFASATDSIVSLPAGLWRFLDSQTELFVSVDEQGEFAFVRF